MGQYFYFILTNLFLTLPTESVENVKLFFLSIFYPPLQSIANTNSAYFFLSATLILLLIVIGFLLLYIRNLRLKINRVEQQLLLSQINPHFIFNSLTAIQSFIFRQDPLQAGKYLSIFAKLVRFILENSRFELTTIEREVKTLRLYFDLQILRFEGKFDYRIEIDESLDIDEQTIPPMLTQPFIENSIEHGFIQLSEKGTITVRFKKGEKKIIIEVEDTGIGVEKSRLLQMKSDNSYLTTVIEITNRRLKKIKHGKNLKIDIEIIDLNSIDISKLGSIVRLNIPIKS
jgi:LytS/YehU family sensor histidine kinase